MSDDIKDYYTREINNYMARFDDLNDVDTDIIEKGIKEVLKINVGIDFSYGAEHSLNEKTGKDDRKVELKNIHILYTYDDIETDGRTGESKSIAKIGKISYVVN